MHITLLIARIFMIGVGALLMYIAFFLHEDEEGRLQNRLEDLWVRIDDIQSRALSKHTMFLKELLKLLSLGFDSLLGPRLLSLRSIVVTLCYSMASMTLVIAFMNASLKDFFGPFDTSQFLEGLILFALLIAMGTSSIAVRRPLAFRIWAGSNLLILVRLLLWARRWARWDSMEQMSLVIGLIGGIACDFCFVVINRVIVRLTARLQTIMQIAVMLACNIAIAFVYVAPIWLYPDQGGVTLKAFAILIAYTNLITAFSAVAIIVLMFVALLHRFFWPFISRPIYAIARHGLVRRPAFLLSAAILLLTWAIPTWKPFWEKLGHL